MRKRTEIAPSRVTIAILPSVGGDPASDDGAAGLLVPPVPGHQSSRDHDEDHGRLRQSRRLPQSLALEGGCHAIYRDSEKELRYCVELSACIANNVAHSTPFHLLQDAAEGEEGGKRRLLTGYGARRLFDQLKRSSKKEILFGIGCVIINDIEINIGPGFTTLSTIKKN